MRDTPSTGRVSLSASAALSRDWNVFLSGGRALHGAGAALEAFAGLSCSLGSGAIASLSHERTADGVSTTSATVQKSLPLGTGYGYQVTASGGGAADKGGEQYIFLLAAWFVLRIADHFVIINYLRMAIGQERGGHISPLAAYEAKTDRFLILDVARYKYPPVWVAASDLFDAMNTPDADNENKTRGYVLIAKTTIH